MSNEPVYEEWESTLIPSEHADDVNYRVFWGTVNWSRTSNDLRKAVTVFMQYGSTKNWAEAKAGKEIVFNMPAHILSQDLPAVMAAIKNYENR